MQVDLTPIDLSSASCSPHTVRVQEDLTWSVFVHGNKIDHITDTPLSSIPSTLNPQSLQKLILLLDAAHVCPGNPDEHFIELANAHKGEFKTPMTMCTHRPFVQHYAVYLLDKEHAIPANCIVPNFDQCTVGFQRSQ